MPRRITGILAAKGSTVWTTSPDATVHDAIKLMAEKSIGAVPVVGDALVGILSERDCARRVVLSGRTAVDTKVSEVMTAPVLCIERGRSLDECMALMTERRIRHLPIVEDGTLVGIVSIGDVVRQMVASRDELIQDLEKYIQGYG